MAVKYFKCVHCKNVVERVVNGGVPFVCCGESMEELIPMTADGTVEKHVPDVTVDGSHVSVVVGSTLHPMTDAHYIQFITLETTAGCVYRKDLQPSDEPKAEFVLNSGDSVAAVYEYCNVHGLWKK